MRVLLRASLAALLLSSAAGAQQAAPVKPVPRAEFVTLGTGGGPIIRLKRSEPANAVVVNGAVYLFDVGEGVQRQMLGGGTGLAAGSRGVRVASSYRP